MINDYTHFFVMSISNDIHLTFNMVALLYVSVGWLAHLLTCFYIIRSLRSFVIRAILTSIPCIVLIGIGSRSLPPHQILSVFILATFWMMAICFIHATVLVPNDFTTLTSFTLKCLWILFPVKRCRSIDRQWSIVSYGVLAMVKFVGNRWLHRWLLVCEANDHHVRVIIYFLSILSFSYVLDIQTVMVRLVTRDQYTIQWLTNFPFLSRSLREFWGQRYNQIIGTVFKESIFRPLYLYVPSRSLLGLFTFTVSGLLHVHIVLIVFDERSSVLTTFACFFLNGVGCCIEANLPVKLPPLVAWLVTLTILFFTAPLCLGPFARDKSVFFEADALSSFGDRWLSELPAPQFCP